MNKKLFTYAIVFGLGISSAYAEKTSHNTDNRQIQYAPRPVAIETNTTMRATPAIAVTTTQLANANTQAIITTATPGFWHRLGSGLWTSTKWTCGLPHRAPTYLLTQLFKLPGLNLLFGEKTAQVVAALGLLALCLYNPVVLPEKLVLAIGAIQKMLLVLTICNVTDCICKVLTSLNNNHPYVLWLFAPAIIVLLSATLYANAYNSYDIARDVALHGWEKATLLLTQTIEQLPDYITRPALNGYQMMGKLLGYPMEEMAMVETCTKIMPGKTPDDCAHLLTTLNEKALANNIETSIPVQMNHSPSYMNTIISSMQQQVRATTDIIKKSATSSAKALWNGAKDIGQRLKAFCDKNKVTGPTAANVGLCTAEFGLPTGQCAALLAR